MSSNVEKIVGEIMGRLKPLVHEAVQRADTAARSELLAHVNKAIGSAQQNGIAEAPVRRRPGRPRKNPEAAAAEPVRRRPGRPRKNPEAAAAEPAVDKPKRKAKAKRAMSEEVRKKLAENLKKARAARAQNAKPAEPVGRRPGRPRKSESDPQAAAPADQA